jgi:hypothetical protein
MAAADAITATDANYTRLHLRLQSQATPYCLNQA